MQTKPSEKCAFNKCDGRGFLHYVDWFKKADMIDNPGKYRNDYRIEWEEECECSKLRDVERIISASGIPEKFLHAKVHGFKTNCYQSEHSRTAAMFAKKVATNYIEKFEEIREQGKGIYLYSNTKGSGKTRLASSIANALINVYQCKVLFLKAPDISAQVRKTYSKDSKVTEEEVLKVFREIEVLVIDDLAVDDKTGYSEDLLGKILDSRMDKGAITIITSNKTQVELEMFYPKGIVASRVKKLCYELLMPEESVRDEEAKQDNNTFEQLLFGTN